LSFADVAALMLPEACEVLCQESDRSRGNPCSRKDLSSKQPGDVGKHRARDCHICESLLKGELEAYHKGHDVHCQQGSHFLTSNCIPYQKWFQQDTCVAAGNGKCREEVCLGGIAIVSSD